MLHKSESIISIHTFELIVELQKIAFLEDFFLVGGTALALQIGHRNSIDIDLFTRNEFSVADVKDELSGYFNLAISFERKNTILAMIDGVKTDFIRHDYPIISEPLIEEGIRMLSKEDIAAMKVHAIIQSGQRLKDFIDIYFLLEHFTMEQIIVFFQKKYEYMNSVMALKALTYFDDIDVAIDPPKLLRPITLKQIKSRIEKATLYPKMKF